MAGIELNEQQLKLVTDVEIEMMADMYNRMTATCSKKCIPTNYHEADLTKSEAVCLDRCVAKYLDIHDRVGKKIMAMSQQDEETTKRMQAQMQSQLPGAK